MPGIEHDIFIFLDDIDDVQFDTELFSNPQGIVTLGFGLVFLAYCVGMTLDAEVGEEIDPFNVDALFL